MQRRQQALMRMRMARAGGMRPVPPVQNVAVPDEYKPPHAVTPQPKPAAPAGAPAPAAAVSKLADAGAVVERIDALGTKVAKVEKRQYRVRCSPKVDIPTYVQVPTTLEELRRGAQATEGKLEADEEVLLYHPHIIGVNGIVFMMYPRCNPETAGIEERYVPIGLSCKTDLAKAELGVGDEKTFFKNFQVA